MSGFITNSELRIEAEKLVEENEKRRKALAASVNCRFVAGCWKCPIFHEGEISERICDNDVLMRELGIEVKE